MKYFAIFMLGVACGAVIIYAVREVFDAMHRPRDPVDPPVEAHSHAQEQEQAPRHVAGDPEAGETDRGPATATRANAASGEGQEARP